MLGNNLIKKKKKMFESFQPTVFITEWEQQSIRIDEHHNRKKERQPIMFTVHCCTLDIYQNKLTLHLIGYIVIQDAAKRFYLCIKLITVLYSFVFLSSRDRNKQLPYFPVPWNKYIYSLILINISGNLNTSQLVF